MQWIVIITYDPVCFSAASTKMRWQVSLTKQTPPQHKIQNYNPQPSYTYVSVIPVASYQHTKHNTSLPRQTLH